VGFYGNLTGRQNLKYFSRFYGMKDIDADARITGLLDRVGLGKVEKPVGSYSRGMKQRLGLAQALLNDPEYVFLDEPTNGLDPEGVIQFREIIRELAGKGKTVFFSSHIIGEVEEVAERVGIIREGRLVEVAEVAALVHRALRRVTVRFRSPVDASALAGLPGVTVLSAEPASVALQVQGEMDGLVKALAAWPVSDLETVRPSLEEVFLAYYQAERSHEEVR
jgi:ABC-2 type transport system ATP-binding protein